MQEALAGPHNGEDVARLRSRYGIKPSMLAAELGITRGTLWRWERPTAVVTPIRWLLVDRACTQILERIASGGNAA